MPFKATPITATTNRSREIKDTSVIDSFNIDLQVVTMGQLKEIVKQLNVSQAVLDNKL